MIDRSDDAVTVVVTVALLFVVFGSGVAELIDAVFEIEPPFAGASSVIVIVSVPPAANDAAVHVTVPVASEQENVPPLVALTKVDPAGSVSVTTALLAADEPAFATASV